MKLTRKSAAILAAAAFAVLLAVLGCLVAAARTGYRVGTLTPDSGLYAEYCDQLAQYMRQLEAVGDCRAGVPVAETYRFAGQAVQTVVTVPLVCCAVSDVPTAGNANWNATVFLLRLVWDGDALQTVSPLSAKEAKGCTVSVLVDDNTALWLDLPNERGLWEEGALHRQFTRGDLRKLEDPLAFPLRLATVRSQENRRESAAAQWEITVDWPAHWLFATERTLSLTVSVTEAYVNNL